MRYKTSRFAPSPSGNLHIGGAMAALYTYLLIKKIGGEMALRIDDTNLSLSSKSHQQQIESSLKWLGLEWNSRPTIKQSERFEEYRAAAMNLVRSGAAYPCFCSPERLSNLRESNRVHRRPFLYDGHCRKGCDPKRRETEKFSIRLKSIPETITFDDMILGRKSFHSSVFGDIVLIKDDGTPTYNFACAWDDLSQSISHVSRGADHLINTPKQIMINQRFTTTVRKYAHFPLMSIEAQGKKMSKRDDSMSILSLRSSGITPLGLAYYLTYAGAKLKKPKEFSMDELIKRFDPLKLKNKVIFNPQNLTAMNNKVMEARNETIIRN